MKAIRKKVDWSKPPELRWEKCLCPVCGQPTGPQSRCFDIDPEVSKDDPDRSLLKTIENNGEILPIFSIQCAFRKQNDYYFFTNYPLGHPLVTEISSVHGLERLVINSPYKGKITIADQFEDKDIRSRIEVVYQDYINSLREKENE
mgnify:CR=1 FL=1